jgi:hypothetical protein
LNATATTPRAKHAQNANARGGMEETWQNSIASGVRSSRGRDLKDRNIQERHEALFTVRGQLTRVASIFLQIL